MDTEGSLRNSLKGSVNRRNSNPTIFTGSEENDAQATLTPTVSVHSSDFEDNPTESDQETIETATPPTPDLYGTIQSSL